MATINEVIAEYADRCSLADEPRSYLTGWADALQIGSSPATLMTDERTFETDELIRGAGDIKDKTRTYVRTYFDARPRVVASLKDFFLYADVSEERIGSLFRFDRIYNEEEICILLLKYLQGEPERGRGRTRSDIAEYFGLSSNMVNKYINQLQDGRSVLGSQVQIEVARGTNECESTVHPIFLTPNLVEVYTLLSALRDYDADDIRARILGNLADTIYDQLSGYAKDKMSRISEPLAPDPYGVRYSPIAQTSAPGQTPTSEQPPAPETIIFHIKENNLCEVAYDIGKGEVVCEGCVSRSESDPRNIRIEEPGGLSREVPWRFVTRIGSAHETDPGL